MQILTAHAQIILESYRRDFLNKYTMKSWNSFSNNPTFPKFQDLDY
jgi:hypothetical protein